MLRTVPIVLIWLLLPHLALAADAPTRPTTTPASPRELLAQRINRCIADLDSPDSDVRDKATADLLAIGPDVVPFVRKAIADNPSPELKTRGEQLLAEVPRQWEFFSPEGGDICAGFQAILRPANSPVKEGMLLTVELRNVGPRERPMVDVRGIDIELPDAKAEFTSDYGDARLVIRKVGGDAPRVRGSAIIYEKSPRRQIFFKTGGSISTRIRVADVMDLPPGEYEVQFIYYAATRELLRDAMDDLRSNTLRVKVEGR